MNQEVEDLISANRIIVAAVLRVGGGGQGAKQETHRQTVAKCPGVLTQVWIRIAVSENTLTVKPVGLAGGMDAARKREEARTVMVSLS